MCSSGSPFELNRMQREAIQQKYTRFSSNECCDVGLSEFEAMSGVVPCRPQSKCRGRPPLRWEMPISSFPGCIKSSLRLACCGCLAASLHCKQGEVSGDPPCGKQPP